MSKKVATRPKTAANAKAAMASIVQTAIQAAPPMISNAYNYLKMMINGPIDWPWSPVMFVRDVCPTFAQSKRSSSKKTLIAT